MVTERRKLQFALWAEGTDFVLDQEASPKREFARLAKARGWTGGDAEWNKCWLQTFNEEYGYIPRKHTPSPAPPPIPKKSKVTHRSKPAMSSYTETKLDFFRICHAKHLLPTRKKWRQHWHECFQEEWSFTDLGGYKTAGPASKLQQLCFGVFEDFTLDNNADVAAEFDRLIQENDWGYTKAKYHRKWCFGNFMSKKVHIVVDNDSYSDSSFRVEHGSDSGTDSDWDFVSNTGSESALSGYSLISANGGVVLTGDPDPTTMLSTEFEQLAIRYATSNRDLPNSSALTSSISNQLATTQNNAGKSKKQRRAEALEADFRAFFGSDLNKLEGWQKLCDIAGLSSDLKSVTQCKKALKTVYINLVNLVQHCRNPVATPLIKFASHKEFRLYTMKGKSRIFPKAVVKTNTFLKALLQRVY